MTKGVFTTITLLLIMLGTLSSCKRRHDCTCTVTGDINGRSEREYRGYSRAEATELCKSYEEASTPNRRIKCEVR